MTITKERKREYDQKYRAVNFARNAASQKRWREANPDRVKANHKRWCDANPERLANHQKKTRYNITAADFTEMLSIQANCCAICGRSDKPMVVDHCHKAESVRALLCNGCNVALGLFKDDPALLNKSARYLDHFGAN